MMKLYFDGACRGNGSKRSVCGCGFVVIDKNGFKHNGKKYIGPGTNNEAEYSGLIEGLMYIIENYDPSKETLDVYGDSNLVIQQMKGLWKVKAKNLVPYNTKAKELSKKFNSISFTHVLRHLNSEADELANQSIDEH